MVGYQLANFVPGRFLSSKGNLVCLLRKCFYCYIDLLFATFYCHNRANFLAKSQICQTKKISRWLRPILWKPKDGLLTSSHDSKHSKKIHYLIGQAFKNHVYKVATLVLKNQPQMFKASNWSTKRLLGGGHKRTWIKNPITYTTFFQEKHHKGPDTILGKTSFYPWRARFSGKPFVILLRKSFYPYKTTKKVLIVYYTTECYIKVIGEA